MDLWNQPIEAARFLNLTTDENGINDDNEWMWNGLQQQQKSIRKMCEFELHPTPNCKVPYIMVD